MCVKKNILILSICIIAIIFVIIIGTNFKNNNNSSDKTKIVTSFYPMYIASLNLLEGIEQVELQNLTSKSTGCVHDYTLTPQEMIGLSNAHAMVINGSGMEGFLGDVIQNYSNLKIIDTSFNVQLLEEDKHGVNPHTFVSIDNHIIQVKNLASMLAKLDNENAKTYMQNADNYVTKLKNLKDKMHLQLKKYEGEKVIALHESFAYFAKDFNLDLVDVIQIEEGQTLSAQSVKHITEHIKEYDVKLIVKDANYESSIANSIAKDNNVATFAFDPVVSGKNNKDAYITKMENNLNNILLSLKAGE
jgi:zinc transport system substrate-binding protein